MAAAQDEDEKATARAADVATGARVRDFGLLIRAASRLEQRIDSALREECGISHTMFELLIRLCREPGERIPQRALGEDLTLTSGGTTRLIDRMESLGLVRREPSPTDRRSTLVEPTAAGRAAFLRAAEVHGRLVERFFVTPVEPQDYARLTHALGRITAALRDAPGNG